MGGDCGDAAHSIGRPQWRFGRKLPDPVPDRLPFGRAASVIAVILLAGALFGYDQGVISGALLGVQKAFAVGAIALEIVTSWVTLGAMFGSLGGGYVADHFGRKRALFAAAALFIIGAAVEALAPNVPVLVFGRLWPALASASPRSRPRFMRRNSPRLRSGGGSSRPINSQSLSASFSLTSWTRRLPAPEAGERCLRSPLSPASYSRSPF